MLSGSVDELVNSEMFKGSKAYGHSYDKGIRLKPWYGFLYIAKFKTRDKLKIGITSDLEQRDQQLKNKTDKQEPSQIYTVGRCQPMKVNPKSRNFCSSSPDEMETNR